MKFTVKYDMKERGLSTLFLYQYFTVDYQQRKNWDYKNLQQYLAKYRLHISESVRERYKKSHSVYEQLNDLEDSDSSFAVDHNNGIRYKGKKQNIRCRVPMNVVNIFKNLFISTLVYDAEKKTIPQGESIKFEFDTQNYTVCIVDLILYQPQNNPYFCYARNAISTLSVEAIGLNQYAIDKDKKIRDFYDRRQMSKWRDRSNLKKDNALDGKPGVYMLFNKDKGHIYIGKAKNLLNRIKQHSEDPKDPINDYTHYRYSVISEEYSELLYLIENAAIHDVAWIIDMPTAKVYTPSLSKKFSLTNCKLINNVEHQTRKQ